MRDVARAGTSAGSVQESGTSVGRYRTIVGLQFVTSTLSSEYFNNQSQRLKFLLSTPSECFGVPEENQQYHFVLE
jgi:hypothetical protein